MRSLYKMIFILCFSIIYSQENNNIEIDYIFSKKMSKKDSTHINKLYRLFVDEKKSLFVSDEKMRSDSLKQIMRQTKNLGFGSMNISLYELDETITFDALVNKITTYKHIPGSPIGYSEDVATHWRLLGETKKVDMFLLNSAEIEFGGRKWIAWYCKDYQLNEGPYKFKNLPGLIFEIHDSENIFKFQLSKILNNKKPYQIDYGQFVMTDKKKYIEVINNYINNPAPQLTKIFTQESRDRAKKNSLERHKNRYYLEKDFE
ncbi:MAG: GLPGLI family protein [Chryseobacterium gambrini]|nr:GLPGLI family protein [Chryseobacterium gambrini]